MFKGNILRLLNAGKHLNLCRSETRTKVTNPTNGMSEFIPEIKKPRLENGNNIECKQSDICDLSSFNFKRVLCDFGQRKTVCIEGTFQDKEGPAVLWLEKTPFSEENIKALCTAESKLKKEFLNDIYGSYSCTVNTDLNEIKTTIIYPATEQHINKFIHKTAYLVEETPEYYNDITLPSLLKDQFNVQWVYNVLDHNKEADRIVFEDDDKEIGFVLLPDLKWNGKQTEDLYLLALVHPRGIKSLRDLTSKHLPLLKNILNKGTKAIEDIYGIPRSQLRVYIHYQPTFYHLHIHFNYLKFEASGIFCEKSHILSSVINNIELKGDYYQKATLPFTVNEGQSLGKEYMSKGIIADKLTTDSK